MSSVDSCLSLLHRRQFVIAPEPHLVEPGWKTLLLAHGLTLSASPEASVGTAIDRGGGAWTLLGNAFQAVPERPAPLDEIASLGTEAVIDATYTWAGRWVLIGPESIVADACGMLGVFYNPTETAGDFLASSSLAIVKSLRPELSDVPRRLHYHGITWYPPPSSKIEGVKKLLPDQALSLQTRAVTHVARAFPERFTALTTDERAELITGHLGNVLTAIAKRDGRVTLALTSGIDSRSTLAAAMASGVEVRAVTMAHPLISKADRLIPPIVCESVNVRHDYLLPGTFDRERNALYTAHTFGNTADADRFFFAHRTFDGLQDAAWLVRSGPWAIAKAFWYAWFGDLTWEELRRRPDWVTRKHRTFSDRQRSTESLRQWIAWRDAHPEPWDWRDLWIRDQRMSGITAAIEQSLDLIDCASICAVNCAQLFDIMLAEPEAARRAKTLQMRVLELSGTGLASIPVNPVLDSALVRHGRKGKRYVANVADERGAS